MYADNIGLVAQGKSFKQLGETLNTNQFTNILQNYFKNWHLNLNTTKITVVAFHLNNREASRDLKQKIDKVNIANDKCQRHPNTPV